MSTLRNNYFGITQSETPDFLTRPMTIDGIPTGNNALNVNGSITPVELYITPLINEIFDVATINVVLADNGSVGISDYGSIAGPLTNGAVFFIERNGIKEDISYAFKKNTDYVRASSSFDLFDMGSGSRVILYKEMFLEYTRGKLKIPHGDKFGIRIRDDLSALSLHTCQVKGTILKASPTY